MSDTRPSIDALRHCVVSGKSYNVAIDLDPKTLEALLAERKVMRDGLAAFYALYPLARNRIDDIRAQAAQLVLDDEGDQDAE